MDRLYDLWIGKVWLDGRSSAGSSGDAKSLQEKEDVAPLEKGRSEAIAGIGASALRQLPRRARKIFDCPCCGRMRQPGSVEGGLVVVQRAQIQGVGQAIQLVVALKLR